MLAEQPFDQIAGVVHHENNRLQAAPAELADFLSRELMGALTRDKNYATAWRRDCRAEGGGRRPSNRTP